MAMKHRQATSQAALYRRHFWHLALRSLPFQLALIGSLRLHAGPATRALNERRRRELARTQLRPYPEAEVQAYLSATKPTRLWHGTGKFHYAAGGPTDVLATILAAGSLNPFPDDYALLLGGERMHTMSTTPLRMIARCYADIHGRGKHEPHRYGSSLFWVAYFYGRFFAATFATEGARIVRHRSKFDAHTKDANGHRTWGKKVHSGAEYVWDVFSSGSDITGNFAILFGIARYGAIANVPGLLAKAEVRLTSPVAMADLSHAEVPQAHVAEVRATLQAAGYGALPVFPLELGEYVASRQSFDVLAGLKRPA